MCPQKSARIILLLTALAVLGGCGALDAILPTTGTYKVNALINHTPLDDFSIITSKDKILPFFEDPVSDDPDITGLIVFLKDSRGLTTGYKVTYSLIDKDNNKENGTELQQGQEPKTENKDEKNKDVAAAGSDKNKETGKEDASEKKKDTAASAGSDKNKETHKEDSAEKKKDDAAGSDKEDAANEKSKDNNETAADNPDISDPAELAKNGKEMIFQVLSLDETLPFFPLPADLPIGKYTLVFQVMGKNTILYKCEKSLFYLADAEFSFDGIQVYLPGITDSLQFIQNKDVILLDINLNFDSRLEPYVVWYNGKKMIDEGRYSDGAGTLFWKAPEQNGFVSIRAEVFPSWERTGLTGYQKGISLLVSSKEVDMHLLSKDTPNLLQWYVFEGDLNDSLTKDAEELVIEQLGNNKINWLTSNGTYGLASGIDNIFKLPDIPLTNNGSENWQIVSRFKPLNEGEIFSVQFGTSDITMTLSNKKSNLILTLASASGTSSETLRLSNEKEFISVSVKFFINNGRLSAKLALIKPNEEFVSQNEPVINPISINAAIDKNFRIILGQQQKKSADNTQTAAGREPSVSEQAFTALWDELAILRLQSVDIKNVKKDNKKSRVEETAVAGAELTGITAANAPNDRSFLPE